MSGLARGCLFRRERRRNMRTSSSMISAPAVVPNPIPALACAESPLFGDEGPLPDGEIPPIDGAGSDDVSYTVVEAVTVVELDPDASDAEGSLIGFWPVTKYGRIVSLDGARK